MSEQVVNANFNNLFIWNDSFEKTRLKFLKSYLKLETEWIKIFDKNPEKNVKKPEKAGKENNHIICEQ